MRMRGSVLTVDGFEKKIEAWEEGCCGEEEEVFAKRHFISVLNRAAEAVPSRS